MEKLYFNEACGASLLKEAFLDFQQHGKRRENELLEFANVQMKVDKGELGLDIKGQPFGIVKHEKIVDFIVECWKRRIIVVSRLPWDRGYLFRQFAF